MKRFQFISRLATSVAAVALTIGTAVTFSACTEENNDVNDVPEIVKLDTPQNAEGTVNGADITFQWDSVEGAVNYAAQIRHSQYGDIIAETITELTYTTFADLENGVYFFRVRANHELVEAQNSDWSAWVEKVVAVDPEFMPLDTPKDVVCVANENTTSSLTFKWEVVENAATYTYKVSDAEGNEVLVAETDALSVKVEDLASNATYTFVVKANPAADSEGLRSSSYSKSATGTTVGLLATPTELATVLRMAEALSFRWAEVENAAAYAYELYEGDMNGEPVVAATTTEQVANVETTNTTASFMGLKKDTYYSFRIKAVPAEGANFVESAFTDYLVVKTLITDATPIQAPVITMGVVNQVKAVVTWNAVSGAASYQLQWGATEAEAEVAEPIVVTDATEYTLKGLEPEKQYVVRIMACSDPEDTTKMNSEYTAWTTIATPALATAMTVSTVEEFNEAIAGCLAPGATLTVKSGNYYFQSYDESENKYTVKDVTLTSAINIVGESATARPVLNYKTLVMNPSADGEFLFENLELTGYAPDANGVPQAGWIDTKNTSAGGYALDSKSGSAVIKKLTVKNCLVHGFNNSMFRCDRGAHCEEYVLENNIISVGGDNGHLLGAHKTTDRVMTVTIKNNTFDNIGSAFGGQALGGSSKNTAIVRIASTEGSVVTIENNTFYNISSCSNNKAFVENPNGTTVFKNNIITIDPAISGGPWAGKLSNGTFSGENNFMFGQADTVITADITGFTVVDPGFSTYKWFSDYYPTQADVVAGKAGDPRWVK